MRASSNQARAWMKNSQLTLRVWWPPESQVYQSSPFLFSKKWRCEQSPTGDGMDFYTEDLKEHTRTKKFSTFARPRWKLRCWHILTVQDLITILRKQPPNRIKRIKYIGTNYPGICKTYMWKSGRHGWKKSKTLLLRKTGSVLRARAWCC